MATLNKIMLMGRLTGDQEPPKVLPNSGATLTKFSIAVGRSKKNPQTGQWENDPNPLFIECEVYTQAGSKRDLAGLVTKYVKKGDPIYVEGRLQLDQWEDKNGGGKRSKHKVVDAIELLGSKNSNENSDNDNDDPPPQRQVAQSPPPQPKASKPESDEIPF